jgi:hypothetical protein
MASDEVAITVRLANDAGITPEMVEALGGYVDEAAEELMGYWPVPEEIGLAVEAMRRLRIAVLGTEAD